MTLNLIPPERPAWCDEKFGQWLAQHCPKSSTHTRVAMPEQMVVNGAAWVREQFLAQAGIAPEPADCRLMFGAIFAVYFVDGVSQREVFQQILEAYLRNTRAKA